jgi:hypothetical protein
MNKMLYGLIALGFIFSAYLFGLNPVVTILLLTLFLYLKLQTRLYKKRYNLLHLSFLTVIFFAVSGIILQHKLPLFYIPFCLFPLLATIIFHNLEFSLVLTITLAVIIAALTGSVHFAILTFISGIAASLLVIDGRRRSEIIRAGFIVGLLQAISLLFIEVFHISNPITYFALLINGFVSGIIAVGVLPVFEYLFGEVTDISLLELSDFNHPLLKIMILNAPGTYHHSLVVGNLAEAAAEAIGANSLLARIGSYYHDIGKIQKPEYFNENQGPYLSKHDGLSPQMSKLVIMNHVKEGLELAKKYKLNPKIVDFIRLHHGTSLVYYFYKRALENLENEQEIKEEGFRYAGPKPNTKETAIVLLADSVEAASRTIKEPTPSRIEEVVHKVINNKFIDGQLDECDLTLRNLEKIAEVFIKTISAIFHGRLAYPEKKNESICKKSSEKSRNLSKEIKDIHS